MQLNKEKSTSGRIKIINSLTFYENQINKELEEKLLVYTVKSN